MSKTRDILRLKYTTSLSVRDIGKATDTGKSTVSEIIKRAKDVNLIWPTTLSDVELTTLLYPPKETVTKYPEPDMESVFKDMKSKKVSLTLLWDEYKQQNPDGLMYTQFCNRYRQFKQANKLTMHIEHKAGEEMQVDWAGSVIEYFVPNTKITEKAYIFVAVLPASNYTFVRAYKDMQMSEWINAHIEAYEYFGGVARITIPDNTKTAVIKPHRFEPILNKTYQEMATHYGTTILPARSLRPKDKGSVENGVGNITRQIIGSLRHQKFFGLKAVNQAIEVELTKFVEQPFQKIDGNRKTMFETIDKPALMPLPNRRYQYAEWKEAKIGFNYHVEYDRFYYSVPYSYTNKPCRIRITGSSIEIFIGADRVAVHSRNYNKYERYTTLLEHMPDQHKLVSKWNSERFLSWAITIGPNTRSFIEALLSSRDHPVQSYKACMGVLSLSKSYSSEIMEATSLITINNRTVSYKYFAMAASVVANQGKDKTSQKDKLPNNLNIRGRKAYETGGILC
jgi:transposase